ncbi:DUF2214 family protein [Reichenbachiella versicolor]|uniref:DUF2214 family protein n=1 Tax=Reichenbachiella versicolor TaxID=1821036 RepID=UPI000D6EAA7D|nr:DUF2214 family protein [Reichenbachiella versicolor]
MIINSIVAFFYFLAAFGVVSAVVYEKVTFKKELTLVDAKRIQQADMVYGLSAALVLIFGFIRVFFLEKGSGFYWSSPFFILKLTMFFSVGVLSIYPTVKIVKWQRSTYKGKIPIVTDREYKLISRILTFELIGLVLTVLCASLMAKGIGY